MCQSLNCLKMLTATLHISAPGGSVAVAVCVAMVVLAGLTTVAAAAQEPHVARTNTPVLPIVVNTWPFVNATRVAFRTLAKQSDSSAIDAVEQVR